MTEPSPKPPILGFAAWSGTGKTTLLVRLLPLLKARGLRVAVVKHAHHGFDIDHPGKDSYELRQAGATQMLIGSRQRWALMVENVDDADWSLSDLIRHLDMRSLDLILVEGYKPERIPKIEINRPSLGKPLLYQNDPSVIAIATDDAAAISTDLPLLDMNKPQEVADFILTQLPNIGRQG